MAEEDAVEREECAVKDALLPVGDPACDCKCGGRGDGCRRAATFRELAAELCVKLKQREKGVKLGGEGVDERRLK